MNIEEISFIDKDYPNMLRSIKNPPKKLYVLGNKNILNESGIAIIGSRDCTEGGKTNARIFATNIAKSGFTIISGMAKGIDTAAHMGALEVNGSTIAVLGNGVDYIFPPQNKKIYYQILDNGGAIISEYPNGTLPASENFRQRNRIVSGLSIGVLIVEAEFRSGTTITARYAKEQKKDVFCIPSSRDNRKGIGTNILIQKGAKLVIEPREIIEKYTGNVVEQVSIEDLEKDNKVSIMDISKIKKEFREIYLVLSEELSINEISIKTGIPLVNLYEMLFMMEIEGLIINDKSKYRIKE